MLFNDTISIELIDDSFVNDEGIPILNDYEDKFNCIFGNNYNIRFDRNKFIYFFTLKDLLNKLKPLRGDSLTEKKIFYGIINKYFPNIKDIKYMQYYNNFAEIRSNKSIEIGKFIHNDKITTMIYNKFKNYKLLCDINVDLLKFVNTAENRTIV